MYDRKQLFPKKHDYLIFWITTFSMILILFLISYFYTYNPYYKTIGIYDKEVENVSFLLENSKLHYIYDSKIRIDKDTVDNKSVIVGEYVYSENKVFNQIYIPVKNINDPIINITFELPKTTILKKIWKGLIEWI